MIFDVQRDLNPRHLQESFDRAAKLQGELRKKESRIKRQAQQLAWGLAALMDPGEHHHRVHVGIHAFDVNGHAYLASALYPVDLRPGVIRAPISTSTLRPTASCAMRRPDTSISTTSPRRSSGSQLAARVAIAELTGSAFVILPTQRSKR